MADSTLLYVMDPHCGWCFGFGAVMAKLYEMYGPEGQGMAGRMRFEVLPGGLFVPRRATSRGLADGIRPMAARISQMAGVTFSEAYFTGVIGDGGYLDSEVPCRVLNTVSQLRPEVAIPFMGALLDAEFVLGHNISNYAAAAPVIERFGFTPAEFEERFSAESMIATTHTNFARARAMVEGYPAVFLDVGGEWQCLTKGFAPLEKLVEGVEQFL